MRLDDWIVPEADRPADCDAAARHRVNLLPEIVRGLRAGQTVTAPGYDPATRGAGSAVSYNPAGKTVIIFEGGFAVHHTTRPMIDLAAFVESPTEIQRVRFAAFYRWKKLDDAAIELLWRKRLENEWPAVDAQRALADLILTTSKQPSGGRI